MQLCVGDRPVAVSPVVVRADLDSDGLGSATVTLNSSVDGDVLGYGSLPTDVTADVSGGVLTFTGSATVAQYRALLESVTLTSADAGIKTVSFVVTDAVANPPLAPSISTVTADRVPVLSLIHI